MYRKSLSRVAAAGIVALAAMLLLPAWSAADDDWADAHATFYGDETGAETMQGACGYGDLFEQGYGLETAALSVALFNDGWSCGGCYEVRCTGSPYCAPGGAPVTITATNLCPANYSKPNENWCNPPLRHFDLSKPMFLRLVTDFRAGIVPVQYRRAPCAGKRGRRQVPDDGELPLVWNADHRHVGQGLSFRVVAGDGRALVLDDVVPPGWAFGQSFEAAGQF
ncbi:hypothetical protein EJB05_10104, partial [Eragrostis curvula]